MTFYANVSLQSVAAEVNCDGEWVTVSGWDVPLILAPVPPGCLRIFSGDEPRHDHSQEVTLTESVIDETLRRTGGRKWIFTFGQWRKVAYGPLR